MSTTSSTSTSTSTHKFGNKIGFNNTMYQIRDYGCHDSYHPTKESTHAKGLVSRVASTSGMAFFVVTLGRSVMCCWCWCMTRCMAMSMIAHREKVMKI